MRTARHFHPVPRAVSAEGAFNLQPSTFNALRALTLLEMMISMTLLAVIMVGLLAMFSHTQKALHIAATQTDVFENARGAIQLVSRDLSEMTAPATPEVTSATGLMVDNPAGRLTLYNPGGTAPTQPLYFTEAFWLSHVNDLWTGIGYFVEGTNYGVGTLYRHSETASGPSVGNGLLDNFINPGLGSKNTNRVSDGIVHFQLTAVYPFADTNLKTTNFVSSSDFLFSNVLPAFVDIDLGVLEPGTLKQFEALVSLGTQAGEDSAKRFLTNHVGKIHFFRERVPIRNFINPYRANEVP